MTTQRFAGLSRRLLRAGVAPCHVKRLIAELEAHFADIVAELRSTGRSQAESESQAAIRLGTEDVLAANIIARPELQSWARQWPWLAFVLLPLLALPLQFVLSMLAAIGVFNFSTRVLGLTALHPGAVPWVVGVLQTYGVWIAPILAAGAACFLAARRGAPALWPIVGSALIALVGASTNASFEWSPAVPRGALSGGIGFHFPDVGTAMSFRAAFTLLIGLATFLWMRRRVNGENQARSP
ncbi:MAG: hypothetical protein E6K24_01300 [Gammaproteobacteria bacterium]|nr:MAG: hypothetical protein E6K24_01300 [Gammaproteobacteria bacterium]